MTRPLQNRPLTTSLTKPATTPRYRQTPAHPARSPDAKPQVRRARSLTSDPRDRSKKVDGPREYTRVSLSDSSASTDLTAIPSQGAGSAAAPLGAVVRRGTRQRPRQRARRT